MKTYACVLTRVSSFHLLESEQLAMGLPWLQHQQQPVVDYTASQMQSDWRTEAQKSHIHLPWTRFWRCELNTEPYADHRVWPARYLSYWGHIKGRSIKRQKKNHFIRKTYTHRLHLSRYVVAVENWLVKLLPVYKQLKTEPDYWLNSGCSLKLQTLIERTANIHQKMLHN